MVRKSPLIIHVIYRLDIGGLENGLVNLINRLPEDKYDHAIVCMDDYSDFRNRIDRDDVEVFAIRKKPGQDPSALWRLFGLFRSRRPDIVHTRNLSALDALLPATVAGVPHRIHGEHGRDMDDLAGDNRKLQWLRRIHRPMIHRYIPLSMELESYLEEKIGVAPERITRIYNGVDVGRFRSTAESGVANVTGPVDFFSADSIIVAAVGRVHTVKGQLILADAFIQVMRRASDLRATARLMIIGDGPLHAEVADRINSAGLARNFWAPGARDDVDCLLRAADVFVQPSLAEGISNTVLEAMATGLPVIASAVGGNPELIVEGETGALVPAGDAASLADQIERYIREPDLRVEHGRQGRARAEKEFSMERMVESYMAVYDRCLSGKQPRGYQ